MTLTIFTPTYNRAYLLPKLFESLLRQGSQNFEWLIVDDGSTDNTAELISEFQKQASFKITYFYQENQGKHIAINTALDKISTPYFLTIDSDDFLKDTGLEIVEKKLSLISSEHKIIGIASPIHILNNNISYTQKIFTNIIATTNELKFKYGFVGELTLIFKTDLAKKYKYPIFRGEKFMLESVVFDRMDSKYKFLYINDSIVNAEYRPDGLTHQGKKILLNSPKGAALAYEEKMNNKQFPLSHRKIFAENYWDYESLNTENLISKFNKIDGLKVKLHMIIYFISRILQKKI
ncbi:glycosyltransferase family 2 protein [Chryseobacterium sp. PBS4-4]|uniref:Glycosyltransferase family 2 protein n=1 Tax=Chryseobacterium edaphi TaxID=2976532 RepID=A0ABT2W6J0_9FLAO|nr:glycosyltransferase family 2 protein [Chryseobacterium edaphi]MCU7617832.1 glycosyltransferase family 2 protein [Chryseobacterium edaphi]